MKMKWGVTLAIGVLMVLGGWFFSKRPARSVTFKLDDGVMACGFTTAPDGPQGAGTEINLRHVELTLQAQGRVVFSGLVERVDCYRDPKGRRGFPGGDAILVALPDEQLATTVARWSRIWPQLGASQQDLGMLDRWASEVTETERAGRNSRTVWLQHTYSIPGTNIGIYVQSIPTSAESPLIYGSHFTVFWEEPDAQP
ncbi:MAG TPA: hypothetical protein VF815_13415 [Myxococcaceae bacterium]|jgi:hypothetical protein